MLPRPAVRAPARAAAPPGRAAGLLGTIARRSLVPAAALGGLAGPALACAAAASVPSPTIAGPRIVRVGDTVRVSARHLVPGHYRLYITISLPFGAGGRPINCIGAVSARVNVASGARTFAGHVPARLSCYQGLGIGTTRTAPGSYALLVGSPVGPAAFSARKSFVRRSVRVVA